MQTRKTRPNTPTRREQPRWGRLAPLAVFALAALHCGAQETRPGVIAVSAPPSGSASAPEAGASSPLGAGASLATSTANTEPPTGALTYPVTPQAPRPTVTEADCPPAVLLDQAQIKGYFDSAKFAGVVTSDIPMLLSGASIFDGPPADGSTILPTDSAPLGDHTRTVWEFSTKFAAGKWLTCDYEKGLVRLALTAADAARDCVAESSPAHGPGNPIKIHWACH